jgi:hypothetical protein
MRVPGAYGYLCSSFSIRGIVRILMTSWHSLLACPQADVTIEALTALDATTGTEPLIVGFKGKPHRQVADCVASMADAYCGPLMIGIAANDHKIMGLKAGERPSGCRQDSPGPGGV